MERWLYLRGGEASLLIDAKPDGDALPRVVHFGVDLGALDFQAIAAAVPTVRWGARLDIPCPPCVLPGAEPGYFGMRAIAGAQHWRFDGAAQIDDGVTLRLRAHDERIEIDYRMFAEGVLAVRVRGGGATALPLPAWAHEVMSFGGDWAREFSAQRQTLSTGALLFESRRGRPGHDRFPGLFVGAPGFGEDHGEVYAITLAWSGSHRMSVERLREGDVIIQAGALDGGGESPWAYATYSPRGLNGAMQALHAFVRERIMPRSVAAKPRPVHYNTWEAIYFDHDEATLRDLADRATGVGAERFVLDDGWFKGRANDRAGLGDWTVDALKFPNGLAPLIAHVRGLGMEFGPWVEPEMVNPDSDLARAHPEWIRRDGDQLLLQRHQAVLDLANPAVGEHLFGALDALLSEHEISYLKWDMNRDLTGSGHGAYVRAVYVLIDRLRAAHPAVEIETCASGGGRCDWGMLSRAERVWVSDSNDALDRFAIQRNAFLFLPPEVCGVHVGPAACHVTGRRLSLDLRAHVATFGHMGLELDLRELSERDAERLKAHVANYTRFRSLLHSGQVWRIAVDDDHAAIGATSEDRSRALLLFVRTGSSALGRGAVLKIPGLDNDATYRLQAVAPVTPSVEGSLAAALKDGTLELTGRVLAGRGLDLYLPRPESSLLLSCVVNAGGR
jgi:alpha-galactosidase